MNGSYIPFKCEWTFNVSDPKLTDILGRYFGHDQVKKAKTLLCDTSKEPYRKRKGVFKGRGGSSGLNPPPPKFSKFFEK